jgi:hypothetical protein
MKFNESDQTRIMAYFDIYCADIVNWDDITQKLGITPKECFCKGDINPNKIHLSGEYEKYKYFNHSSWEYGTEYEESLDIQDQLIPLLGKFAPKKEILAQLKKEYSFTYRVQLVILIENGKPPAIYFSEDQIKLIAELGAVLDVDTYAYS